MSISKWLFFLALLLPIFACAGMSSEDNQNFRSEVEKTVYVNMPLTTAEEHLTKAGFYCDDRSDAPEITCTRNRDNIFLYSCIQRVNLFLDSTGQAVAIVKPQPIQCAGL